MRHIRDMEDNNLLLTETAADPILPFAVQKHYSWFDVKRCEKSPVGESAPGIYSSFVKVLRWTNTLPLLQ